MEKYFTRHKVVQDRKNQQGEKQIVVAQLQNYTKQLKGKRMLLVF